MVQTANGANRSGFSHWLRTGRLPTAISREGVELKFNPWHDPEDGRFTSVGAGSRYGSNAADPTDKPGARASSRIDGPPSIGDRRKSHAARLSKSNTLRAGAPDPPQIGWAKETIKSDEPWKAYNDSATGARSGQAPTPMQTMPDGSKRPVKFDGILRRYTRRIRD